MTIAGSSGNDLFVGGSANDQYDGGNGDDRVFSGKGNDFVQGGAGNDHLDGGAGNDVLYGGTGRDDIFGGAGDDKMAGEGGGLDYLNGGLGADRFMVLASDADSNSSYVFYTDANIDQWVRLGDVDFAQGDVVDLADGDASDGSTTGFLELAAAGINPAKVSSLDEFLQLARYLQANNQLVENSQQDSLTFLLTDAQDSLHAVEFYGYSMSDIAPL